MGGAGGRGGCAPSPTRPVPSALGKLAGAVEPRAEDLGRLVRIRRSEGGVTVDLQLRLLVNRLQAVVEGCLQKQLQLGHCGPLC